MTKYECLKNDEARSSKVSDRLPSAECGTVVIQSFDIRASFDIPSFVIRHFLWGAITLIALSPTPACPADDPPLARHEFREPHMGTQFRIVLYTSDEPSAIVASRAAFDRIEQLDAMLSDYRADSELMRLCAKAGGPPEPVSEELFFVLSRSQELSKRSDGAFDVTVGPVVRLWRRARRQYKLPDPERLAQARELVGYEKVRLSASNRTVQLLKPNMQIDLGGIAKGYAADEAMSVLKMHGVTRALVAASGDIVVSDPPPDEPGWTIGIAPPKKGVGPEKSVRNILPGSTLVLSLRERKATFLASRTRFPASALLTRSEQATATTPDPFIDADDMPPLDSLLLRNAAISTSGDAEQFIEIDGRRYSHIVDPKTGLGLTDRLQVTVVASTGTGADSLATAVCVLGIDRGLKLIETIDGTAAMIARSTDEGPQIWESSRFKDLPRGKAK